MLKNKTLADISFILLFGLLTGILTSFGQTFIPKPLNQLANSYSVWLLMSFVAGLIMHRYRYAMVGGALIQYLAIAFYYLASITRFDTGFSLSGNIIWILGGTIAGPLAGFLGAYLKRGQRYDFVAPAFMAALAYSEALYQCLNLKYFSEAIVFIVLGTLILVGLLYAYKTNVIKTIITTVLLTAVMYALYGILLASIF